MEENGRASSSGRTKYINIRYYFIKYQIDCGDVTVQHCPTDNMVADYFTNPLQGRKFREFSAHIMGLEWRLVPVNKSHTSQPRTLKSGLKVRPELRQPRLNTTGVCWKYTNQYNILSSK